VASGVEGQGGRCRGQAGAQSERPRRSAARRSWTVVLNGCCKVKNLDTVSRKIANWLLLAAIKDVVL
jgi:hypothetical protein